MPLSCPLCSVSLPPSSLEAHLRYELRLPLLACLLCPQTFCGKDDAARHFQGVDAEHPGQAAEVVRRPEEPEKASRLRELLRLARGGPQTIQQRLCVCGQCPIVCREDFRPPTSGNRFQSTFSNNFRPAFEQDKGQRWPLADADANWPEKSELENTSFTEWDTGQSQQSRKGNGESRPSFELPAAHTDLLADFNISGELPAETSQAEVKLPKKDASLADQEDPVKIHTTDGPSASFVGASKRLRKKPPAVRSSKALLVPAFFSMAPGGTEARCLACHALLKLPVKMGRVAHYMNLVTHLQKKSHRETLDEYVRMVKAE